MCALIKGRGKSQIEEITSAWFRAKPVVQSQLGIMWHHLFILNRKSLPIRKSLAMRDSDVALVRHFLIEGASNLGEESLANAIAEWAYQGPGVWVGVDETVLVGHRPVFAAGIKIAEALSEQIPLDYLNNNARLPGGRWLGERATSEVVALIRSLEEYCHGRT
jgi:hypothetical protein